MRRVTMTLAFGAAALVAAAGAQAHAFLDHASAGGRRLGNDRAGGRHLVVHTRPRTGVQQRDGDERSGTAGRSRQYPDSARKSGRAGDRAEAAATGDIPGQLARRFGRHPPDRRHFYLRGRERLSLGTGQIVAEVLIVSRLLHFAAVIVIFGCGAFRIYGLGVDATATAADALTAFDAWFWRVPTAGAII